MKIRTFKPMIFFFENNEHITQGHTSAISLLIADNRDKRRKLFFLHHIIPLEVPFDRDYRMSFRCFFTRHAASTWMKSSTTTSVAGMTTLLASSVVGAALANSGSSINTENDENPNATLGFPNILTNKLLHQHHGNQNITLAEKVHRNDFRSWVTRKDRAPKPMGEVDDHKDTELFENQCLKRQMHKPAVPYPAWDYNWDGKMTPGTTLEAFRKGAQSIKAEDSGEQDPSKKRRRKKSRHIILIRHGQYEDHEEEEGRVLTPLGRYQARATGKRLAQIAQGAKHFYPDSFNGPCHVKAIHVSELVRARETAELIAEQLQYYTPKNTKLLQPPDPLLNETLPAPMVPIRPDIPGAAEEIDANQERVEEAFRKYFFRDDGIVTDLDDETSNDELDEFEIIVGHGNMIRWFLCRALQLPPEAWLRFSTFNCSITYLVIRPEGLVVARSVGDTGHLNYDQISFSGYHGLKW
jgi:serine/threonine-protein phosphatase PGAM5